MATVPGHEIVNGILFVTGTLDRSADTEFQKALEKYSEITPAPDRVVDMTNVRWLAPAGAKALIAAAQEATEKGGKLRVLASRHVMQTLNLLGAKSWLTIETCLTPNPRPGAEPPAQSSSPTMLPTAMPPIPPSSESTAQIGAVQSTQQAAALENGVQLSQPDMVGANDAVVQAVMAAPAPTAGRHRSGASSSVIPAIQALAAPGEELSRGGTLLKVLYANRRYNFHFASGPSVLGIVRERIGGSWVLVETTGTRKIVNLDLVQICELL